MFVQGARNFGVDLVMFYRFALAIQHLSLSTKSGYGLVLYMLLSLGVRT